MTAAVFGGLLREHRLRSGLTQDQLAARSGISTHTISTLEAGHRPPRLSSVAALSLGLGLDLTAERYLIAAARRAGPVHRAGPGPVERREAERPAPRKRNRAAARTQAPSVLPRLLPCPVADFAGRQAELNRLAVLAGPYPVGPQAAHPGPYPAGLHPAGPYPAGLHPVGPQAAHPGLYPAGLHPAGPQAAHPGLHPAGLYPAGLHPAGSQAAVRAWVIHGMPGTGKTSLAVQAAHAAAGAHPDGQIYLDLHGFTPGRRPVDTATALARLLWALAVPAGDIPERTEERLQLWRSTAAGLRLLVVLDNAASAGQVLPLLPTGTGSAVLVTSRRRLATFGGAVHVCLEPLAARDAASLFAGVVGADRAHRQERAVAEILALCGHLPLTVRVAAARLAHRPAWTPSDLLAWLRDPDRLLERLSTRDLDISAALAVSHRTLTPRQRGVLQAAARHPGDDFAADCVADRAGLPLRETEGLLDDLYEHHLVLETSVGRYRLHNLVRAYALRQRVAGRPRAGRR